MIKRALLLLLLTAVWAFGSWWYYTCMIKGFCKTDGAFTSATDRAKTVAATGAAAIATTAAGLAGGEQAATEAPSVTDDETVDEKAPIDAEQAPVAAAEEEPVAAETSEEPAQQTPPVATDEFIDQDNDAISDEDERRLGTDPTKDDSDADGLKDNEELGADLQNPTDTDQDGIIDALDDDDDNDSLTTAQEQSLGTDPRNADTDDDGLSDALEAGDSKTGTDPLNPDTDNDGISDGTEVGSEPGKPMDTDKDGIIDALDEDDDNDGISTADEVKANTDPLSPDGVDKDAAPTDDASAAEPASDDQVTVSKADDTDSGDSSGIPIQKSRLYFPSRSANPGLSDAATDYFKEVANWLNADPSHMIVLTGHTDDVGKAKNNLNLGLKRAVEIKNLMVKLGANESQIDVASMGETQPIDSNKTDSGRRKNRRVELIPAIKQ